MSTAYRNPPFPRESALRNLDDPGKYASSEFAAIGVDELTNNPLSVFKERTPKHQRNFSQSELHLVLHALYEAGLVVKYLDAEGKECFHPIFVFGANRPDSLWAWSVYRSHCHHVSGKETVEK